MSAFIQSDRSMNAMLSSYLVQSNAGQLQTRAGTPSQRMKKNYSLSAYLFAGPNRAEEVASFKRQGYFPDIPSSYRESPSGRPCRSIGYPQRYTSPSLRKATLGIIRIHQAAYSCLQPDGR